MIYPVDSVIQPLNNRGQVFHACWTCYLTINVIFVTGLHPCMQTVSRKRKWWWAWWRVNWTPVLTGKESSMRSKRFRGAKSEERGFRHLSPCNSLLPNRTETLATQAIRSLDNKTRMPSPETCQCYALVGLWTLVDKCFAEGNCVHCENCRKVSWQRV